MPRVEVDEEQWNAMHRTMSTLREIAKNPNAKKLIEQAHKMVDPQAPQPTIEAEKPLQDALDSMNKTLADLRAEREAEKTDRERQQKLDALTARQNAGWDRLKQDRTWTQAGLAKVQEIMDQKGILDPEDAAVLFLRDNPPPPPAMPGGTGPWNFLDPSNADSSADDIKKLIETKGESTPLLDKMAREALMEIRGQSRR